MNPQPTLEDLKNAAVNAEGTDAPAAPPETPPYTELDGIKVGKTQDGKWEAVLPTGARYLGESETQLALNIAKGKVEADKTLKQWKDEHPPAPAPPPEPPDEQAVAQQILLDHTAKALGFDNGDQLKQFVGMTGRMTQEQMNQEVAAGFQALCPDFPESEANNTILLDVAEKNHFPLSPMGLRAAHMIAVAEKQYNPLTPDQIQAQRMEALGIKPEQFRPPAPPPMLPGQGNNVAPPTANPWDRKNVSLDALRQAALEAERNG